MAASAKKSKPFSSKPAHLFFFIVLATAALFLGNIVGNSFFAGKKPSQEVEQTPEISEGQGSVTSGIVIIDGVELKFPTEESPLTPEEQEELERKLSELAVEQDTLKIGSGCSITPRVVKVKSDQPLTLVNRDNVDYEIKIGTQEKVRVSAGEQVQTDPGLYPQPVGSNFSIGCEGAPSSFVLTF